MPGHCGRRVVSRLTEVGARMEQVLHPGSQVVPEVIDGTHYWSVYVEEKKNEIQILDEVETRIQGEQEEAKQEALAAQDQTQKEDEDRARWQEEQENEQRWRDSDYEGPVGEEEKKPQ